MRRQRSEARTRPAWQLHRIRLGHEELIGRHVVLSPANTHHVRQVLRLRPGARLRGLTPNGPDLVLRVHGGGIDGRLRCSVEGEIAPLTEPPLRVSICQGLTRAERFESVVQKCSELGAWDFHPVLTARSVVRPDAAHAALRVERWRRIAEEAALQCGRTHVPAVHPVTTLAGLAGTMRDGPRDLMLVPYEGETAPLRDLLKATATGPRPLTAAVVTGPEGGFEAREIELLRQAGFSPVSLGPRILRTETAGPLALSLLLYELGDVGGPGVER